MSEVEAEEEEVVVGVDRVEVEEADDDSAGDFALMFGGDIVVDVGDLAMVLVVAGPNR